MFRRIKRLLDQTLDHLESMIDDVTDDDVDRLIRAMRDELVETKARIPELETLPAPLIARADREKAEAEACDRRAAQALEIGDAETQEVAERFAGQHRQRLEVLVMKAETTRQEILQHRDEAEQMTEQLKDAMARRDTIGIQQRRARAIENKTSRFDSVDAFDRMADRMEGAADVNDAARELDFELDPLSEPPRRDYASDRAMREAKAEDLLEELKRRMGTEK
ncbi:MAG: PspA/IM30 family protein [Gemmatimonadota bacterium]